VVLQAPALFPRVAADGLEATPRGSDASTVQDRRVAWSAVQAVLDAWLRSFRQPEVAAPGAGLRGGRWHVDYGAYDDHAVLDLLDVRFVRDVAVHGRSTLSYDFEHPRLRAVITINGAGTDDGQLTIGGAYWFDTFFGDLRVRGTIGGRTIDVTVPSN
jgi:hypothetical protein